MDVNISLTSVEMVWKVSDVALTKSKREKDLSNIADKTGREIYIYVYI